jgi:Flp pilus assembly pilin Flp
MINLYKKWLKQQTGQAIIEYALTVTIIAISLMGSLTLFKDTIGQLLSGVVGLFG